MTPKRIVFIRQREGGNGHHDAFIAVERDDTRWYLFGDTRPACGEVGGGGAYDLLELCRLDQLEPGKHILCHGHHLDSPQFEQLLESQIYPGAIFDPYLHDRWWEALAHLRPDWIKGDAPHWNGLRDAVAVTTHQLARMRESAKRSRHWRDSLRSGQFLPAKPEDADRHGEPYP